MFWKKTFCLLLLLQISLFARGKRRIRKRDDASADPLLAEIFKSTEPKVEQKAERRPDRALDPGEELEAILTGFKNKKQHLFPVKGPIKRASGLEPGPNGFAQQNIMQNILGQNPEVRDTIPRPDESANLMQIPSVVNAAVSPDAANLMQLPEQPIQGNTGGNFMEMLQNEEESRKAHELQAKNFIPGRPSQLQNNWGSQPGVTVYLHQDKKSSIPIPVKTGSAAVQSKGSFPLQMRKISPNMNLGSAVPHQAEYGETVESLFKKPEEIIAKKSEIPHAETSKKSDVAKETRKNETAKPEAAKPEAAKQGESAKKDYLQQPLMMQPQQLNAFQTTSPFGGIQGGQSAALSQGAAVSDMIAQSPAALASAAIAGEPCTDQYNQCAAFAKNDYCVKYPAQMSTQCRRSCQFCVAPEPKQQIATSTQGTSSTVAATTQFSAQGAQANPATQATQTTQAVKGPNVMSKNSDEVSGSGSGDASGSGESPEGLSIKRSGPDAARVNTMYLPELGSGVESGSGSGESSGSEADVVRQLASAQNIVSGVEKGATAASKTMNNTKKSFIPLMKNALKNKLTEPSAIVKKSSIPQRPVSPLKAMDVENVDYDDDDASASGSGSGSGEEAARVEEIKAKPKIRTVIKKQRNSKKNKKRKQEITKKSEIAKAPAPLPNSAYPRIDLRKIASALANYEEAALTLAGEYPRITSQDTDVVTRSHIPHPNGFLSPFSKLRQNIQIAKLVTQNNNKRFEIPKYLLVGDQITEKDGLAKESPLPSADTYESVTQRFAIPGVIPSLQEYYAETGKPLFESDAAKRMRITRGKKKKIQKPIDPFEYLRNMPAGASMEPIIDPRSVSSTRQSVSYPVYLMKVMPGSHKYVAASTRSKVNAVPKKPGAKANAPVVPAAPAVPVAPAIPAAPIASQKQTVMTENANANSEFETGPGPEMGSFLNSDGQDSAAPMEIELGPPKEQSASMQDMNGLRQPMAANTQPIHEFETQNEEQPALRTKMLSAFFNKKKNAQGGAEGSGFAYASKKSSPEGSGATGNFISTRDLIFGETGV